MASFLDFSPKTLDNAVIKRVKHQLGRELSKQQIADIVTLPKCLTGELPVDYVKNVRSPTKERRGKPVKTEGKTSF